MSIWSSIGAGSDKKVLAYNHDGYGKQRSDPMEVGIATAWDWNSGIRLSCDLGDCLQDGVMDRESAMLLQCRLQEAMLRLDFKEMKVNKVSLLMPISVEEMIDAGNPAPEGYVPPTVAVFKRRHRLMWWLQEKKRQFGLWIAGENEDSIRS
jgi:hypothetical protein